MTMPRIAKCTDVIHAEAGGAGTGEPRTAADGASFSSEWTATGTTRIPEGTGLHAEAVDNAVYEIFSQGADLDWHRRGGPANEGVGHALHGYNAGPISPG